MGSEQHKPIVHKLNGPSDLLPLVSTFADLTAGTEFGSYKDPQWRFLLCGEEITAFAIHSAEEESENDADRSSFDGCVLRMKLDDNTLGFGMVLTRPSKRGRGIAKALLKKAMERDDEVEKRFVLALCSSLGQPLYRKLGFKDAGMVTLLTCSVFDIMQMPRKHFDNEYLLVNDSKRCIEIEEQLTLLVNHDSHATGINRRDRLKLLLNGYAEGSRSTVAFYRCQMQGVLLKEDQTSIMDIKPLSTAVARQDCIDGPLTIGPMKGKEECCIPLIQALIEKHFENQNKREDVNNIQIMMMVTDHLNLVTTLLDKGMEKLWSCPAMTSDGEPVYQNGDGSYLSMMHPTLG